MPLEVSREVLATAPAADEWLTTGIMAQLRRTVVRELLIGSGATGHAQGIIGATDVETVATPGALTALDFAGVQGLKKLAVANQVEDRRGDMFALSTSVADKLEKTALQANRSRRLLERLRPGPDGAPYSEVSGLGEGYRNSDMTTNTAIYGDFGQVVVGVWGGDLADDNAMYIVVNPYANDPLVKITAYLAFDVAILRPDRFATALYT